METVKNLSLSISSIFIQNLETSITSALSPTYNVSSPHYQGIAAALENGILTIILIIRNIGVELFHAADRLFCSVAHDLPRKKREHKQY